MNDDVRAVLDGRARWCVVEGDSADVLATLPAACVDAVVTDPPSGIAFMGAEWDHHKGGRAQWVAWLARILGLARVATKDGGRAFVWSLPRTSHWTGCAVEDAGWLIETTVQHLFATGWPKGSSQLKPAAETWWLARTGRSVALNVEACRVGVTKRVPGGAPSQAPNHVYGKASPRTEDEDGRNPNVGRYPPNVLLSHTDRCVREGTRRVAVNNTPRRNAYQSVNAYSSGTPRVVNVNIGDPDGTEVIDAWRCDPACPVATLDAQAGEREGRVRGPMHRGSTSGSGAGYGSTAKGGAVVAGHDEGGETNASRFYPQLPADDPAEPWNAPLFRYEAKPSRAEKETGVTDVDAVQRVQMAGSFQSNRPHTSEGYVYEPSDVRNDHPTVKPIALMRWLIRLITQPGDLVLDPFGGSGTTGAAALLEGRRVILIEREARYAAIARARCEHAQPSPERLARIAVEPVKVVAPDFGPLFGGAR